MTQDKQKTDRSADHSMDSTGSDQVPSTDSTGSPQADSLLRQPVPRSFSEGGGSGGQAEQAPSASSGQALRKRAEEKAGTDEDKTLDALSPKAARQMLHELRVHQIELEMQNEELRRVEAELEASRARYFDLYDVAPVGYLTLSEQGLVLEANLTAATLLGVARGALVKQPVTRFIFRDDWDIYYLHRKKLFETGAPQVCELRLVKKGGAVFWARLEATAAQDAENGDTVCRAVMSDITERKRAEEKLNEANSRLQMLQQITASVHSTLDLEEVFRQITDSFVYSIGYNSAIIIKRNGKKNRFEVKALSSKKWILTEVDKILGFSLKNYSFPVDPGLNAAVNAAMRGEIVVAKTAEEVLYPLISKTTCSMLQKLGGIKNYILVPLQVDKEVVGGVIITTAREEVPEEEFKMVNIFAQAASHAIQNANLHTLTQQAKEALRESEERYRSFVQNLHGIAYKGNVNFEPEFFHGSVEEITGYTEHEFMEGKIKWDSIIHKDDLPDCLEKVKERIVSRPCRAESEFRIVRRDGSIRWIHETFQTIFDQSGEVIGSQGIQHDITERKQAEEALRQAEENFRRSLDDSPLGVRIVTTEGEIVYANRAILEIYGYDSIEELRTTPVKKRYTPESYAEFQIRKKKRQQGEYDPPEYEISIVRKNGEVRHLQVFRKEVLWNGEKQYQAIYLDITERKQTEEALRLSEGRLRSVFNNAFVGMAIVNPEGHVVEANEPFCRFLGYSCGELVGRHFTEFTHPEDMSIDSDLYAALLDDERLSYSIDKRYFRKGKVVWGRLSVSLIKDEAGQLENMVVVREDITERKRAEEALRESEEKYRLLVENINEAIFVAQEERLKFVNRKALETLGYTQEEITSRPFSDLIHPEDREMVLDNYLRKLRGETVPSAYAFRLIDKDGNTTWVELGAVKIDWEGKPATLNFATDITERKRAEGEMGLLQEQFRHSQKMEAVGRLAGGIAHDFNNLLTVIRGYSELCLGKLGKEDPLWRKVEGIWRASEQASRLTSQLLAFSRHQVMEMKVINLNKLFNDLDGMLRRVIGEDIELVTILAEDLGRVKVDPGQMEQVIMNLAVNARDSMPNGGRLTIEAKNVESDDVFFGSHAGGEPGRYVMFSISDMGFGMTPEVKEHLFEPFFTTKEKGKGTGLGLSTVYGIVKQSGGEITVKSAVDKGSAFRIYLPLVEGVVEDQKEEGQEVWGGKETVMVVEDNEEVRRLMAEVLEEQGYRVLEASGGEEALGMVEEYEGRIDLLLTDVVMPGMNGRELGKRFVERRRMVKVLYMSGFVDDERVPWNVSEEGMNYIQKPITIDKLIRKVREVLDK